MSGAGNNEENAKRNVNSYVKYSALGFQMFAIIAVFAFVGYKIDEYRQTQTPVYTAFLCLAGVFVALYQVIRSIKSNKS